MTADSSETTQRHPLAGRTGWLMTDGKAGMLVQARGVADALGLDYREFTITPRGLQRFMAPWGGVSKAERFGQPGAQFAPPWPAVAIATGRASIPYIRTVRKLAGPATYTVVLQDPKSGRGTADLICVPAHDTLRGPNVMTTLTAPHSFSQADFDALRADLPPEVAALPRPRVAVNLGGKNGVYKFTDADDVRFETALRSFGALGASFLVTSSRRSHQRLIDAADRATSERPRILWTGEGPNPYATFLAAADVLVVTADSVNMTGEACATGRPVYVFTPSGGSPKFSRFHQSLIDYGATRPLPDRIERLEEWHYTPLDSASLIAQEIEERWRRRAHMLSIS